MSGTLRPISSCYEDFPEFQRISKSCIKGWGRMYRVEHFRQWMKMGNFEDSLHPSGFFRYIKSPNKFVSFYKFVDNFIMFPKY